MDHYGASLREDHGLSDRSGCWGRGVLIYRVRSNYTIGLRRLFDYKDDICHTVSGVAAWHRVHACVCVRNGRTGQLYGPNMRVDP